VLLKPGGNVPGFLIQHSAKINLADSNTLGEFIGDGTMRNHRLSIIKIVIAAALSLQVSVAQAAGSFRNVNSATHGDIVAAAGNPAEKILNGGIPTGTFDNISEGNAVIDVPNGGIVYATELFGSESTLSLPSTKKAAVLYTIDGKVDRHFNILFTLSDGKFAGDPKLAISDAANKYTTLIGRTSGGNNANSVTFFVEAGTKNLADGDQLMLVYQLKELNTALATPDRQIELTAELKTPSSDLPLNPPQKVTLASAKQAVKAELKSENTGIVKISISNDRKKLTGSSGGAYINETTAQIGFLTITHFSTDTNQIMASDGETQFKVGEGTDSVVTTGSEEKGSKLTITGGQFDASKTLPGEVYLYIDDSTKIKANVTNDNIATFQLDDAKLQTLSTGNDIAIRMTVDGSTAINTVENQPEATLTIDFNKDDITDIGPLSKPLRQIHKDGTVCVVYIVPAPGIPIEKINIRITNDSNVDGAVSGRMYNEDGKLIGSAPLTDTVLKAGETLYINATDLEKKFSWTGRAMMEITAALPKIEVLALMRNQKDRSLLTNLSQGAKGNSCTAQ